MPHRQPSPAAAPVDGTDAAGCGAPAVGESGEGCGPGHRSNGAQLVRARPPVAGARRDGLRRLLKVTGWQPEETLFIGDDQNDLPAVKYFHGCTVETAEPFMKEAATKVYPSVGDMLLAHL